MATKLVPIPAGKPGTQLDIFDEMFNQEEGHNRPQVNWRQPAQPIPPTQPCPTPLLSWQKPISQTDPNVNPYKPTKLTNEVKALLNL